MRFEFPVEIRDMTPEEGGGILVRFPDWWNGAATDGGDLAEALANAKDCLETMIAYCVEHEDDIPLPSPANGRRLISPDPTLALKAALWLALREQGVSFDELARRLGLESAEKARRLVQPRRRTRSQLLEAAAAALGKRVVVELQDAA